MGKALKKTAKGFIFIIAGLVMMYVLFVNVMNVFSQSDDIKELKAQRNEIVAEKKSIKNEISLLNDDDYVTRYARENYVFTKDGEQVAIIPNYDSDSSTDTSN
ncbi:MAG: septum formation initiator family protein [Thomasclavelia sp.]|nr:septum formation initiator family protein [Thomasclavelia sp.]